jgi:hypothetical protein
MVIEVLNHPVRPSRRFFCAFLGATVSVVFVPRTSGGSQFLHVERFPIFLRVPEVILNLLVKPAFRAGVEGHRETDRHLRANARTPVKNARQRLPAHAKRPRGQRTRYHLPTRGDPVRDQRPDQSPRRRTSGSWIIPSADPAPSGVRTSQAFSIHRAMRGPRCGLPPDKVIRLPMRPPANRCEIGPGEYHFNVARPEVTAGGFQAQSAAVRQPPR